MLILYVTKAARDFYI